MSGKRIGIGARPTTDPQAQAWIRQTGRETLGKGSLYTARLTLDITPALRARIKVAAFGEGITVAEMLRELLERRFPEDAP
ncbi:hypothetical protein [Stutzerimonas nitrititolerans]|uniref:hypothetical protein n=1 Tax=Stutzerimonas nitrititolerans TaxID=2482751 RepID=UPI00289AEF45|nr:hypothetical protein [Stutzerimonas nitrititolerans]